MSIEAENKSTAAHWHKHNARHGNVVKNTRFQMLRGLELVWMRLAVTLKFKAGKYVHAPLSDSMSGIKAWEPLHIRKFSPCNLGYDTRMPVVIAGTHPCLNRVVLKVGK